MPLVFLPESETLFLWGPEGVPPALPELARGGQAKSVVLVTPGGRGEVPGLALPLQGSLAQLAVVPVAEIARLPASMGIWALASKLALELVSRERVVPTLTRRGGRIEARWAGALAASEDAARIAALARSMPPAAHAVPISASATRDVWAPDALLRAFIDASVDALVRAAQGSPELKPGRRSGRLPPEPWSERWASALTGPTRNFEPQGFQERSVPEEIERWSSPALGARERLRACFRLELPEPDGSAFVLRFLLQSPDDPSLLIPASDVWKARGRSLERLGRAFRDPQESLLGALGRAARLFAPIEHALSLAKPESIALDAQNAWTFLGDGAAALADAGFGVLVPSELTATGQRRLRLRMRVGGKRKVAGAVPGASSLGLDELLDVDWEAIIGDRTLSARELAALARQKAPLVRFRGAWVAIDPRELDDIRKRVSAGSATMTLRDAVKAALAEEILEGELPVAVAASGRFAELLERLRQGADAAQPAPATLQARLRPYQARGFNWLVTLGSLGLGACLADDMGLGKTIQLLAFLLWRSERARPGARPALLVAPTSVLGNWEREIRRFAPSLVVTPHYGNERARRPEELPSGPHSVVITSYGVLRRDSALLTRLEWSTVALDEAQNIKNAASATARAARALRSGQRFALTGTPVENRLAELWSILEFANPGLLGSLEKFRREFAVPIERYGNDSAAARLRRTVSPFVLRRVKSDPLVIQDLPPKNEMVVACTLTREQATLYKAVVDEELRRIAASDGMERRGRVLALLLFTKQVCNHPAQYLSERGPLAGRSGKLARVTAMLDEAISAGDKALVFTQFREMGERLLAHFQETLGVEALYLHGGTPKASRDDMVRRFQEEAHGPRVFVLSLKAGGTGLNLTAAAHVFHYDRWWNPAVEDQATDRAFRIGQTRAVQVHKLVCAGTVEEKIHGLLERKRQLASKVVGAGEHWITELETDELQDLFALSEGTVVTTDDSDEDIPSRPAGRRARVVRTKPGEVQP